MNDAQRLVAAPVTARLLLSYDSRDALIGAVMRHDLKPTRGLEPLTPCLQASGKFVHERVKSLALQRF